MKFAVSRTSSWKSKNPPCEEAYWDSYIRHDQRSVDDPSKIPCYRGDIEYANRDWYGNGSNHRIKNGNIVRDFDDKSWFVDISNFDELLNFSQKYGELVLGVLISNEDIMNIEIYDDYRE